APPPRAAVAAAPADAPPPPAAEGRRRGRGPDRPRPAAADTARVLTGDYAGGRFELVIPAGDSLARYGGWEDTLRIDAAPVDQARIDEARAQVASLAERLPAAMTPRPGLGFSLGERLTERLRYNRVMGTAPGLSYRARMPGVPFGTVIAGARYGVADERLYGSLALQLDRPGARWTLSGFRALADQDPIQRGLTFGSSLRAMFTGRDEGDYYLSQGATLAMQASIRPGLEFGAALEVDHQSSVTTAVSRGTPYRWLGGDIAFQPVTPVPEGWYGTLTAGVGGLAPWRGGWGVTGEVRRGAGRTAMRLWAATSANAEVLGGATLRLKAGVADPDGLPQFTWRAGGQATVRGQPYGAQLGAAFWSAQADLALVQWVVTPVLFADAGQARPLGSIGGGPVLAGAGAGLSAFGGLVRLDVSHPLTQVAGRGLRVDLAIFAVR
ncbi:MAG: hypothetical protein NW201_01580, partial [Gemmatimonadales bacterium]|nr:hypothetical protein [Gemmatimonadales bacterium]